MAETNLPYNLAAVRLLLLAAFSAEDLRRFCEDRPAFRPILSRLSEQQGLDDVVEQVIDYCERHLLFDQLLDAVREENPAQYARFEPQLRDTSAGESAPKILKAGSVLLNGRYRIVRHIARGGFGSVYLAEDRLLNEQVAVKELIPVLVGDDAALRRFLVEAKAMMQLAHPRIVLTRDVFEAEGNYYMVMEHMRGGSLEDRILSHKALPVGEAVRILAEACEGLGYAHARGVVHCDLKPSNILLTADGSAKVSDFGVAYVSGQTVTRNWMTEEGFSGGTLPYLSPEQADGVRNDPRIDIYALGAVLYRALSGRMYLDFDQRHTPRAQSDNVRRIYVQQPPPPSTHNPGIPAWLDAVVLKALAKRPEDRYASAGELRSALLGPQAGPAEASQEPGLRATAAPGTAQAPGSAQALATRLRRMPAWLWLAAGGAVVLIILLAIAVPRWTGGRAEVTPTIAPSPIAGEVRTATQTPSPATPVSTGAPPTIVLSGQGRIAFTHRLDSKDEIYVMNADGSGQTNLTNNPAVDSSAAWSPEGQRLAFASDRDGSYGIYAADVSSGGQMSLPEKLVEGTFPAWSHDGRRIAFVSIRDGNREVYVMDADGNGQTNLTNNPAQDTLPAWSPDGTHIAFVSNRDGNDEIYVMGAGGAGQTKLTDNPGSDSYPAWSPDGSAAQSSGGARIAFASDRDGDLEIYVMEAGGSGLTKLTDNQALDSEPAWSPDGRYIVFATNRDGNDNWEIYVMNADGSGATRLTNNTVYDAEPAWTAR